MALNTFIEVSELQSKLDSDENIVVLATSMKDPFSGQQETFNDGVIPGSLFFDFEEVFCDLSSDIPHTMPSADIFEQQSRILGINCSSEIIVYDFKGVYSAPRVWWMFKAMGHNNVKVLNGGFPAWKKAGALTQADFNKANTSGDFVSRLVIDAFVSSQDLLMTIGKPEYVIVDARSTARFLGQVPEPRKGLRSGHITGSKSLPFTDLIEEGKALESRLIDARFDALGLTESSALIFSCGSGVTACVLALFAMHKGYNRISVYDGSWSEWGADESLPISIE